MTILLCSSPSLWFGLLKRDHVRHSPTPETLPRSSARKDLMKGHLFVNELSSDSQGQ